MPRILVVDDEPDILEVMRNWLAMRRYDVLSASNSAEAIHLASSGSPDLILLDAVMPGVDGIETCRILRTTEQTRCIPVILISNSDPVTVRIDALMAGADDYVTRPVILDDLNTRIHILLSNNGALVAGNAHLPNEALQTVLPLLACELVWLFTLDDDEEILKSASVATRWNPATAPGLRETITLRTGAEAGRLGRAALSRVAEFNLPLFDLPGPVLSVCQDLDLAFISLIPLRGRNARSGLLLIGGHNSQDIATAEGRQRMIAAVSQITTSVENAHLAHLLSEVPQPPAEAPVSPVARQEDSHAQHLDQFWQILENVQQTTSLERALQDILNQVVRMLEGALAMILLLTDLQSDDLAVHAAAGLYARRLLGAHIPRSGIAGVVLDEHIPLLVNDADHDPHFMLGFDDQWGMQVETIVAAPLVIAGQAIGLLEVVNSRTGAFKPIDRDMLQGVAYLASLVIEKGRLSAALADISAPAPKAIQSLPETELEPADTVEAPLPSITGPGLFSQTPDQDAAPEKIDTDQPSYEDGYPPTAAELMDLILDVANSAAGHTPLNLLPVVPAGEDDVQKLKPRRDASQIKTAPLPPLETIVKPEIAPALLHRSMASLKYVAQSAIESARYLAEQSGVDLVTIFDEFLPELYMDRGRVLDVIETLLESAIGASSQGDYVKFVVRDIIDELQIKISYQVTELPQEDYTSIQRVIEQHGGQFSIESDPQKGTSFTFTLPKSDITGMGDFLPAF
ncbi:MAG: response regulator [Anaerolineae bacterium]|nr:response regulator [Anaerolineae bacterium]